MHPTHHALYAAHMGTLLVLTGQQNPDVMLICSIVVRVVHGFLCHYAGDHADDY